MTLRIILSNWDRIRTKLVETIDCFEEQDLSFHPRSGLWTVRELMIHIAHEEMGEVGFGIIQELQEWPPDYDPSDYETIDSIKRLLSAVHAHTLDYLETLTDADLGRTVTAPWDEEYLLGDMVGHVIEHEVHHRGELSLILGLLGRTAPDA
ncbi:MAG: DinB family protein [Candidatus Promineifilaceae bacterium]